MKAVGVDGATSLIVALVSGFLIFLFVRTRGERQGLSARGSAAAADRQASHQPLRQLRSERFLEPRLRPAVGGVGGRAQVEAMQRSSCSDRNAGRGVRSETAGHAVIDRKATRAGLIPPRRERLSL